LYIAYVCNVKRVNAVQPGVNRREVPIKDAYTEISINYYLRIYLLHGTESFVSS